MIETDMSRFVAVEDLSKDDHVKAPPMSHEIVSPFGHICGRQAMKNSSGKWLIPMGADWSSNVAQGIFRSATLRVVPDVYISDAFVRTSVTDDTLTYDVAITNTGSTSQDVTLSSALSSWNCDSFTYPALADKTVTAAPNSGKCRMAAGGAKLPEAELQLHSHPSRTGDTLYARHCG